MTKIVTGSCFFIMDGSFLPDSGEWIRAICKETVSRGLAGMLVKASTHAAIYIKPFCWWHSWTEWQHYISIGSSWLSSQVHVDAWSWGLETSHPDSDMERGLCPPHPTHCHQAASVSDWCAPSGRTGNGQWCDSSLQAQYGFVRQCSSKAMVGLHKINCSCAMESIECGLLVTIAWCKRTKSQQTSWHTCWLGSWHHEQHPIKGWWVLWCQPCAKMRLWVTWMTQGKRVSSNYLVVVSAVYMILSWWTPYKRDRGHGHENIP